MRISLSRFPRSEELGLLLLTKSAEVVKPLLALSEPLEDCPSVSTSAPPGGKIVYERQNYFERIQIRQLPAMIISRLFALSSL
jgi:hypothetical protein